VGLAVTVLVPSPGGGLVVQDTVLQAVVERANQFAGQAAQGGFVAVARGAALVVVGAGTG
jgi:hypothetical protein